MDGKIVGMKFEELAGTFSRIESTDSRNEKTEILAEMLGQVGGEEMEAMIYLSLGRLRPLYDSLEFDLAEKMVFRVVSWATGKKESEVKKLFKKRGDLGDVVEELREEDGKGGELNLVEVYGELVEVAKEGGEGSQERKVRRMGRLLKELNPESGKYVVRLVLGKLRLGFSDMTMLDALSWMKKGDKSDREELERAFNVSTDLARIAGVYKEKGIEGLGEIEVEPGVPIRPAKAERLGTLEEIVAKLEKFAVEPKMDGMRMQIHIYEGEEREGEHQLFGEKEGVVVKVFSRGMEDVSKSFPDVVEAAVKLREKIGKDVILDAEAIGFEKESGELLPFQETVKRKRKYGVSEKAEEIPLKVFVFDLLYEDGGLLQKSFGERRGRLEELIGRNGVSSFKTEILPAESVTVKSVEEAEEYFEEYVEEGLEGMMCKRLKSEYQAGARNFNWVKFKRVHDSRLLDTVDVVVLGYYRGRGKRQKFGLGAFLVGVKEEERFLTVAKIGTGLTDEQFGEMYEKLKSLEVEEKDERYEVDKSLAADVWVEPELVVEIAADEITESPVHSAGYALRFPRLKRFREEKSIGQATTLGEVEKLFESQR